MGAQELYSHRVKALNIIFTAKAILAVLLGCLALSFNAYKVYDLYQEQQDIINQRLKPVEIDPSKCLAPTAGLARLEPPENVILMAFHIDWIEQIPISMNPILGFTPATINAYLEMDTTLSPTFNYSLFEWHAQEVQRIGGMMAMTMQPLGLDGVTDEMLQELADECFRVNTVYGVPLFLRYGHEMNGDWTLYGMQPTEYIRQFRTLTRMVRELTNMTAMVFGPNNGINYPFLSPDARSTSPLPGTADFIALDTNRDGVVDNEDDPYLPYYPGDDAVDWVAISQYWYPDQNTGFNIIPPATYFYDSITSTGPTMELQNIERLNDPTRNFYDVFVVQRGKPLMIPETSAPFVDSEVGPASDPEIKRAWWDQMLGDTVRQFMPRLKMITQFEENKADGDGIIKNWRVTSYQGVLDAFLGALQDSTIPIAYATDFKVDCGGNWIRS